MTRQGIGCPHCGRLNEQHDGDEPGRQPKDGDISVCWGCRQLVVFVSGPLGVTLREPTQEESAEFRADQQVRAALAAMAESYDPVTAVGLWRGGQGGGM